MNTYVAEIDGRAVIAFRAENEEEAQAWLECDHDDAKAVRADLMVLESEGRPVWDGEVEIVARPATIAEQAAWRSKSVELGEEYDDHDPDDTLVFLVPVTDPTDND